MGYTLFIVSHTHWDREWYLPFQEFRLGLAVKDWDDEYQGAQLWWLPDWRRSSHIPGSGTFQRK